MASEHDNPERAQRVADLLRTAAQNERAPDALHARISAMQARTAGSRRHRPLPRRAFNYVRFGMPAAAAGAAALVIALGGAAGAPTLAQAAALSLRAPTSAAPATDPQDPVKLLSAKVGTLHFPNWQSAGGWRAVGARHDHIGNRTATTVYYARAGARIAYSIVSSPTLHMQAAAVTLPWSTVPRQYAKTLWNAGRATVVWEEAGHTCLLTGSRGMPVAQLWQLAFHGFRRPLAG